MAAPNSTPAPILVEYPRGTFKRDEPTAGGAPQPSLTATQRDIFQRVISGPLPSDPSLKLVRLAPGDGVTCYRNAVLGMLFNLKPFLNLLHEAARNHPQPDQSLKLLRDVAALYWDATKTTDQRRAELPQRVEAWWRAFRDIPYSSGDSWHALHDGRQADASEFYHAVLDVARDTEYPLDEADVLEALLHLKSVQRRAYECDCKEKQRRLFDADGERFWYRKVNTDRAHTPLASLLSNQLYAEMEGHKADCPTCGGRQLTYRIYEKFANLPEVFMVGPMYATLLDKLDPKTNNRIIAHDLANDTDQPERLDLTFLRDFPSDSYSSNTSSQTSADRVIYELQSVIGYHSRDPTGGSGHYDLHVKRPDGTWNRVDDYSKVEVSEGLPSLSLRSGYRARMLAYVRVRDTSTTQLGPSATAVPIALNQVVQTFDDGHVGGQIVHADVSQLQVQQQAPLATQSQAVTSQPVPGPDQPSTQNNQDDGNADGATADPETDATNWTQRRLLLELKKAKINIGRTSKVDKLRDIWNRYQASSEDQKLSFLLKDGLRNIMDSLNIEYDDNSTNAVLIRSIMRHRRASSSPSSTTQVKDGQDTGAQATKDDGAGANDADKTSNTPSTGAGNTTTDVSGLQNIIQAYMNNNAALRAHNAQIQRDLDASREQNQKDAAQIQTYQDQVKDLKRRLAECEAGQKHSQDDEDQSPSSVLTPAQQASVALNNVLQSSQQPQHQQNQPYTLDNSYRVLRVTTYDARQEIDPITNQLRWVEDNRYLKFPSYMQTRPLTATSWHSTRDVPPDTIGGDTKVQSDLTVNVAIKSQDGSQSLVYAWSYRSDVKAQDRPEVIIDLELLTVEAGIEAQEKINQGVWLMSGTLPPTGTLKTTAAVDGAAAAAAAGAAAGAEAQSSAPVSPTAPGDQTLKRPRPQDSDEDEQQPNTKKVRFDDDDETEDEETYGHEDA